MRLVLKPGWHTEGMETADEPHAPKATMRRVLNAMVRAVGPNLKVLGREAI